MIIELDELILKAHGKPCSKGRTVIATKANGTVYAYHRHASATQPTEAILANRQKFLTSVNAVKAILADPEKKATALAEFRKQKKYSTLFGYLVAQERAKA